MLILLAWVEVSVEYVPAACPVLPVTFPNIFSRPTVPLSLLGEACFVFVNLVLVPLSP